jgi:hypothetical protein
VKFFARFSSELFLVFWLGASCTKSADMGPQQKELKTYALPKETKSADISPDEQFVVIEFFRRHDETDAGTNPYMDVVQLRNFKEDRVLAEFSVPSPGVRKYPRPDGGFRYSGPPRGCRAVQFSQDGKMVLALIGRTIHFLSFADLTEIRTIDLVKPDDLVRTTHTNAFTYQFETRSMALSPSGDVIEVFWTVELKYGRIQLYDFSAGKLLRSWETPEGWAAYSKGPIWHPNGKKLLVAMPNQIPCRYANKQPDVFAFDAETGQLQKEFTSGLQISAIATSMDNRIFAVQDNCFQLIKNRDPDLRVFDLDTGKLLRGIAGRGTGVHYSISVSDAGNRLLAFTGNLKTKFDVLDATTYGETVDETFSVWNLKNYEGIVTSQNVPGLRHSELKLSSKGNYALSYGKASFVYELP